MTDDPTDFGMKMILDGLDAVEDCEPGTEPREEQYVRNLPTEVATNLKLELGRNYRMILADETGKPGWKHIYITGLFLDGFAYIEIG